MLLRVLKYLYYFYSRQLDRQEQSKDDGPGQKVTRAESPGCLAKGKTGKPRTSPPG